MRKSSLKKEDEEREEAARRVFSRVKKEMSDIVPVRINVKEPREEGAGPEEVFPRYPESGPKKEFKIEPRGVDALADKQFLKELPKPKRRFMKWAVLVVFLAALISGIYAAMVYLPEVEITLKMRRLPWEYHDKLTASLGAGDIPAQLLSQSRNIQFPYKASGKGNVSRKAKGVITIYNAYGTSSQALVATTRFLSPDGKIFRLVSAVEVPGAKMENGKLVPQSVEAEVAADKPGSEYNLGPVQKWTIPGLAGSPKHEGFYGVSSGPMSGGFIGETAYPTTEDKAKAREEALKAVKASLSDAFALQLPKEFTVLNTGGSFKVVKEMVLEEVDSEGKFRYFIEAKEEKVAIREADILTFLTKKAESDLEAEVVVLDKDFKYAVQKVNNKSDGTLSDVVLSVDFKGTFTRRVMNEDLKSKAVGKSENDLKTLILGLPGVEGAKISFWPFWVKSAPSDNQKIKILSE